jgi:hypothetical protein
MEVYRENPRAQHGVWKIIELNGSKKGGCSAIFVIPKSNFGIKKIGKKRLTLR